MTNKQIKVLLVEDNPGDAFLIQDQFRRLTENKFQLIHVVLLEQAIISLETDNFDVILLDLLLPDSQGLETFLSIKAKAPEIPVVVLTVIDNEELGVQTVRQGAQDYLFKGQVAGELLVDSLHYAIERKRIQEELKKHSLEQEVLNQELEAFNYTVSHDLRNSLTNIKGMSDLLLEYAADQLDENQQDWLENIYVTSERMQEMIQHLLLLSQVKQDELEIKPVNLSSIAQQIIDRLQQQQPERQVEFVISPEMIALGDEYLLQIALENILNNAWKYTKERQKARIEFGIYASTQKQTSKREANLSANQVENLSNQESVYFVQDNGVGFDMQNADQLFIPFQGLESSSKFEGTGIGLVTVQRIIRRHGGKIWAESAADKGATFYFTLQS